MKSDAFKAGYVAIIGRPNVGKSTLMNHALGTKLSITSRKPQTTRHQILGVLTRDWSQIVFIDTPGVPDSDAVAGNALNRYLNRAALGVLADADVVVFMIDARGWTDRDLAVLKHVSKARRPIVLALNKTDRVPQKSDLLPLIEESRQKLEFEAIVPISALKSIGLDDLLQEIENALPLSEPYFAEADLTDRPLRFLVGELLREQVVRQLGDELPHRSAVTVDSFLEHDGHVEIEAVIWVERASQRGIVVGVGGKRLKQIGREARLAMEQLVGMPVHLHSRVRVRKGWSSDLASLSALGYQ